MKILFVAICTLAFVLTTSVHLTEAQKPSFTATLALTDVPQLNSQVGIVGCGYIANENVGLILIQPEGSLRTGGFAWWGVIADSDGCIVSTAWIGSLSGEYELQAYQGYTPSGRNKQIAELIFTVE